MRLRSSTPDALWSSRALRPLRPLAIDARGVVRRTGPAPLGGVDLQVEVGGRLLLASEPEGAASLLLRVLVGLARRDAGRVTLVGIPDAEQAVRSGRVAYLAPSPALPAWLSPREALGLAARLAGLDRPDRASRVRSVVERCRLTDLDRPMGRQGTAVRQRVELAAALLSEPELLLADDPLRAVEPDERRRLLRLPGPRRTLVVASRYPASEQGICSEVALLAEGRCVLHAPISTLAARELPLTLRGIEALAAGQPQPDEVIEAR